MHGACPCGRTRYRLEQAPILVHCCHCTTCQRQLGTAFAINAIVETDAITLLPPGQPATPGSPDSPLPTPTASLAAFARLTSSEEQKPSASDSDDPATPSLVCLPTSSTVGQTVSQCSACHSVLWAHYADAGPHVAYLRVGTLDAPWEIRPDVHIFTRSMSRYVAIPDGDDTPRFEEYYPDRAAFYRPEVLPRVRALEHKAAEYKAALRRELGMSPEA